MIEEIPWNCHEGYAVSLDFGWLALAMSMTALIMMYALYPNTQIVLMAESISRITFKSPVTLAAKLWNSSNVCSDLDPCFNHSRGIDT